MTETTENHDGGDTVITPLQFTQDGEQVHLTAPWPSHTSIMHGMIDGKLVFQGDGVAYPKEVVTIKPANGMAQYRIASDDGETMVLELTPGSAYEPVNQHQEPPPKPTAPAESELDTAAHPPHGHPDAETMIRRTIIAEACMLRPEWAKTKGLPPAAGQHFDPDSISYDDLPDDVLPDLLELFSDPDDLDLYTVVKGEITARATPDEASAAANENVRTVDASGKHIA